MLRALIVDDEAVARRRLSRLLAERDDVEVIGECSGGRAAVERIRELEPDLVLLDVQMPDLDGFEVLKQLDLETWPAIVFVTAYDQYAVRAFDAAAVDYLLKPYTAERLHAAVDRAIRWAASSPGGGADERLRRLIREVVRTEAGTDLTASRDAARPAGGAVLDRFVVRRTGKVEFVRATDVDWIESDGNYVRLHVGQQSHLVRGTISACAERLAPGQFVRVHRRYIVNLERVKELQPWFGGDFMLILTTGHKVRLSRTFRESFMSRMLGD